LANQDILYISIITIINTAFLVIFVKWVLPELIKNLKEAKTI